MSLVHLFINTAYAADSPAALPASISHAQNPMSSIIFMLAILVVFYFFLVRPQQKKAKAHRQLIDSIQKGDEVVTVGGILGRVSQLHETVIELAIAENVHVKVQRSSIVSVMPKGSLT